MQIFEARVVATARIAAHVVRVTLGGPGLDGFRSTGVGDEYVRLFLPHGTDRRGVRLPHGTETAWAYPDGVTPGPLRTYTIRAARTDPVELDIDIALHDDGIASSWAQVTTPGDVVGLNSPAASYCPPVAMVRQCLVADLAGLPALARILENTPAGVRSTVVAEVPGPEDEVVLPTPPDTRIRWIHGGNGHGPSRLAEAVRSLPCPRADDDAAYTWVAGETRTMRAVRSYFRKELGLPSRAFKVVGYWIEDATRWQERFDNLPNDVRHELFSMWDDPTRDADDIEDAYIERLESLGL